MGVGSMSLIDRSKAMYLIAHCDSLFVRDMNRIQRSAYASGIAQALFIIQSMDSEDVFDHCPNCGADMRGGVEDA